MKILTPALLLLLQFSFGCNESLKFKASSPVAGATSNIVTIPKPPSAAEREAERKKWETTPGGIAYKKWEASPEGKKVLAGDDKIEKQISDSTNMEAVVTSLSLPPGSRLGFAVMAGIAGVEYIVKFEPEASQLAQ